MANTKKTMKFKEAEPIVDQNAPVAAPVPATDAEVAQAAPVADTPVMPANDETFELPAEDAPVEEGGVELNPATVGVEVQIPTDQLAQAVAMATGDVTAAETAPDALAAQQDELGGEEPLVGGEVPVDGEAPVEAPVDDTAAPAPVVESCESKPEGTEKVEEASSPECDASEAATKHDEDKLDKIILTGVKNTAKGLSDGKDTAKAKEDKLDIMKTGVDNTAKGLKEAESVPAPEKKDDVKLEEACEDCCPECGKNPCECEKEKVQESEDPIKDSGEEPEEKLDFAKLAADVDAEDANGELPPAFEDGEGLDADVEDDLFDDFDLDNPDVDGFMDKLNNFLKDEPAKPAEVADSLRTAADFIEEVADTEEVDGDVEDEIFDDVDEEEGFDFKKLLDGDYEDDVETSDIFDDADDDFEDEEDDDFEESLVRVPCKFPKKNTIKESANKVADKEILKEDLSGIKFPEGSGPATDSIPVEPADDMVRAHEKVVEARRAAIKKFRESVKQNQQPTNHRFNEALRTSVRMSEKSGNSKAWSNNQFYDRYDESQKLDFKKLLENGYLG